MTPNELYPLTTTGTAGNSSGMGGLTFAAGSHYFQPNVQWQNTSSAATYASASSVLPSG